MMRILSIERSQYRSHSQLVEAIHRLRASIFRDRLGWDVSVVNGLERDEYDDLDPTYIVALTDSGSVGGCARLLPAMGPTMAALTFPQLLTTGQLNAHPGMIESSRFCVDTTLAEGRGGAALHAATLTMFAGVIDWSMVNGYREIVTVTDVRLERILKRAGWPLSRLGEPKPAGNTIAVAVTLPTDTGSFERLRPAEYRSDFSPQYRNAA